jgi:FtsH-binding integral membrane protein
MSDPRTNPYATPIPGTRDADGGTTGGTGRPGLPSELGVKPDARLANAFLTQSFLWMFLGLLVTAGVAYVVQGSADLLDFAANIWLFLIIGQVALALGIQFGIRKFNATIALGLFFVYAASLGLSIGLIVSLYTEASVVTAFLSASAMFGGAAIYGHVTKRSLASLGGVFFMGIIGLVVASVLNIFLLNDGLSFVISIIGVVLFTALTAYGVQRIQNGDLAVYTGSMEKAAVLGALHLYLDFINIFLFLLRIFGSRD